MANALKLSLDPKAGNATLRTIYTCPALKSAIVKSVIASNGAGVSSSVSLAVVRASVPTNIASSVTLAANASVNLLAGTLTLQAGDALAISSTVGNIGVASSPNIGSITQLVSSGGTIIAGTSTGIWRSTDAMVTWTQVYNGGTVSSGMPLAKIGSSWFVYPSITTAIRSTDDGLTWTSGIAVTNAPNVSINAQGDIVYNGTVWGGLSGNRLTTTSDGITWALATVFPVANPVSLVWSGTRWVAGRNSTAAEIYWSTDGVAWTTVAAVIAGTTAVANLATDGAGRILATNIGAYAAISTDHGSTWTFSGGGFSSIANSRGFWTGTAFITLAASNYAVISTTGNNLTWETRSATGMIADVSFMVLGGNLIYTTSAIIYTAEGTNPPEDKNFSVSASVMEVS